MQRSNFVYALATPSKTALKAMPERHRVQDWPTNSDSTNQWRFADSLLEEIVSAQSW